MSIKLNLGCGNTNLKGYINIDCIENEFIKPDIKADVSKELPFESNSVDEILASHVIEHFRVWQLKEILFEWRRVLKVGGKLIIECPDIEKAIRNFKDFPNDLTMNMWAFFGDPHFQETSMEHHWAYSVKTLIPWLVEAGFTDFKETEEKKYFSGRPDRDFKIICIKSTPVSFGMDGVIFTTDDLCPSNLKYFKFWDKIRKANPELKLIAFTIANFKGKENVKDSKEFYEWWEIHKDWVEIGVHGYDHLFPPEGERANQEELMEKARDILLPFLPENHLYRPP